MSTIKVTNIQSPDSGTNDIIIDASGNVTVDPLYVDATNNRVGIGTTSPGYNLHIHEPTANTEIYLKITSALVGSTASDGMLVGVNSSGETILWNQENTATRFGTNNTERMRIDSSGRLLVGTSSALTNVQFEGVSYTPVFQVQGTNQTNSFASITRTDGSSPFLFLNSGSTGNNPGSGNRLGGIIFTGFDGTNYIHAAGIEAEVDGTPGADDMPGRLVFSTTADGNSSPTERMRIDRNGNFFCGGIYSATTASGANVRVSSNGQLERSTSSAKYKINIETLEDSYADALLNCRPVWYRSTCEGDNPDHSWWGFIAEEVAAIDPRLVHWKTIEVTYNENGSVVETPCEPEPEGVAYERFVPHLLNLIKRQKEQIEAQGTAIAALEARLSALEAQ